ncbi:MAG: flagellar export protein FliJ [Thermodesulfobacteriota bacterium]|nr:flagellar export protein FliJ [Thermodesulfobacteriota bacterium]
MKEFKLQVVLEQRQRLEDQAQLTLAEALQHEREIMNRMTSETCEMSEICRDYEDRQAVGMQSHEFELYENRISHARQILNLLDQQLGEARNWVLQCREKLGEAGRDKKLLEKLKEKKLDERKKELNRREMKHVDEVAIMFRNGDK